MVHTVPPMLVTMCIILFAWQEHPDYPLVVAANRDEFHQREAEPACWRDGVCCGLDLEAGGTWLGVTENGRFAALTNYREPVADRAPGQLSRGRLPQAFLQGDAPPEIYLQQVRAEQRDYAGFNLLAGDREQLWFFSNRDGQPPRPVSPGIHGLSNGLLDEPWPKTVRGKRLLAQTLDQGVDHQALLTLLQDRWRPEDRDLPDTGVGLEMERLVAPIFIHAQRYGTRASTSVMVPKSGPAELREQCWGPDGQPL